MSCSILTLQSLPGRLSPTDIYFKELLHAVVGAGHSEVCRVGRLAGNSGRVDAAASSLKSAGWTFRQGFCDVLFFLAALGLSCRGMRVLSSTVQASL